VIVARIDDEVISAEVFVKLLKLSRQLDPLLEKVLIDKLLVHAAKKSDISVTPDEIQDRVDEFRRGMNLHRAQETIEFLDNIEMKSTDLEAYIADVLYREKMLLTIYSESAINQFYNNHNLTFERVGLSHIAIDSLVKAQEIFALLEENPEDFADLALQHSEAQDTRKQGGYLGKIPRGVLPADVEAKVFNATSGSILGPFKIEANNRIEIFKVMAIYSADLDDKTVADIKQKLFRRWLSEQLDSGAHQLELI